MTWLAVFNIHRVGKPVTPIHGPDGSGDFQLHNEASSGSL